MAMLEDTVTGSGSASVGAFRFQPLTNVVGLSYRDGMTFQDMLYAIRDYVNKTLRDSITEEHRKIIEQLNTYLLEYYNDIVLTKDGWETIFNAYMEDVDASLQALNDTAASVLVDNPASNLRKALNGNFVTASKNDVTLYVASHGDDGNSGSESAPLKTLASAVAKIPDTVRHGHVYTIYLFPGVWNERLALENRTVHGTVIVEGMTGDRALHKVLDVVTDGVVGHVEYRFFSTTKKNAMGASFRFNRAHPNMVVDTCLTESDPAIEKGPEGVIGVLADYGSNVIVKYSDTSGKRYGLRSNYQSRIFSLSNTGSNNIFGLGARWGGIMQMYGTQPTGDTATTSSSGGLVVHSNGGKVGMDSGGSNPAVDEICLVSRSEPIEGEYVTKTWAVRSSNSPIANAAMEPGKKIRLYFRKTFNNAVHSINVTYAGQPNTSTSHFANMIFVSRISTTGIESTVGTVIARRIGSALPEEYITMSHSGADNIFYVDVSPGTALVGTFGIDITISNHRPYGAPTLFDVRVI